ncbi:MAG TPA: replicative DNA helicase [Defluviicoccus sp.]|nr:replicative DNA helicase [Defluviicoccus sp.]
MTTTTLTVGAPEIRIPGLRRPPHNVEAEAALLGAILVNNRAYERIADYLRPEHFALAEHRLIFEACQRLIDRSQVADPVTLKAYFEQGERLSDVGGAAYLFRLAEAAVSVIDAAHYGRLVHDLALRRELITLGEDVVNRAYQAEIEETAFLQIEGAEQRLYDLATAGTLESGFETFETAMTRALRQAEAAHKRQGLLSGVPSGFRDLDEKLGGLHPSDLLILAGRPSMGKTALATNIAFHAARACRLVKRPDGGTIAEDGAVVGFFSLEMSREQLATRILAEQTGVSSEKIRRGQVTSDKFPDLVHAAQELQRLPFFIDDTPALSISAMRTRARRMKRRHHLGMIVVDYLQLIAPSAANRYENRVQELSEITRGLKALAKELNVPILALSQLSRAVEQREDKRPQLADLRESGTIEQDADVVMFIFREEYYVQRQQPNAHAADRDGIEKYEAWQRRLETVANKAEVLIAKQRHGPTGNVPLIFDAAVTAFRDAEITHVDDR